MCYIFNQYPDNVEVKIVRSSHVQYSRLEEKNFLPRGCNIVAQYIYREKVLYRKKLF